MTCALALGLEDDELHTLGAYRQSTGSTTGWKQGLVALGFVSVVAGSILGPETIVQRARAVLDSPWFPAVLIGLYLVRPSSGGP